MAVLRIMARIRRQYELRRLRNWAQEQESDWTLLRRAFRSDDAIVKPKTFIGHGHEPLYGKFSEITQNMPQGCGQDHLRGATQDRFVRVEFLAE